MPVTHRQTMIDQHLLRQELLIVQNIVELISYDGAVRRSLGNGAGFGGEDSGESAYSLAT